MNRLAHDIAMGAADDETVDLRDARDDAWYISVEASKAYEKAHSDAYNEAYRELREKHGIE
jgi:hypothetical protein